MARTADQAHRSALLERVVDYAQEHGIAELSLRPLGEAVGASPRTLLYYFKSKDDMLAEALRDCFERNRIRSLEVLAPEGRAMSEAEVEMVVSAWHLVRTQGFGLSLLSVACGYTQHVDFTPGATVLFNLLDERVLGPLGH